jgi:hypothetical protein
MAHYGVKNSFKMLTYYLYAPLFVKHILVFPPSGYALICSRQINQLFLPCTALIYHLFQQALTLGDF